MKSKSCKSINITIAMLYILAAIFSVLLFAAPWAFGVFCDFANYGQAKYHALLFVFYICSPVAAVTIFYLNKFLKAAKNGEVFTAKTVKTVSVLSWMCFSAVPLSMPLCFFIYGSFPIPLAAFFSGFLLRVVKNVIKEGARVKEENELTI